MRIDYLTNDPNILFAPEVSPIRVETKKPFREVLAQDPEA